MRMCVCMHVFMQTYVLSGICFEQDKCCLSMSINYLRCFCLKLAYSKLKQANITHYNSD